MQEIFKLLQMVTEQLVTVDNDLFTIAFTNKGGQPKWVELKKFKNMDSGHVKLAATDFDKIRYTSLIPEITASQTPVIYIFNPEKL